MNQKLLAFIEFKKNIPVNVDFQILWSDLCLHVNQRLGSRGPNTIRRWQMRPLSLGYSQLILQCSLPKVEGQAESEGLSITENIQVDVC